MSPDDYCREIAAPAGSTVYYSLLPLAPHSRRPLTAVHALRLELTRLTVEHEDERVAQAKLNWWREELQRLFVGRPQHPISRALAENLDDLERYRHYLQEMLDGAAMDLTYDAYPSFEQVHLYCRRQGGITAMLLSEILGYREPSTLRFARELGSALQLVQLLRNVRSAAHQGRFYLPENELQRFGVDHAELLQSQTSMPIRNLLKYQAERARDLQHRALEFLSEQDRHRQCSQLILANLSATLLDEIEANGFTVLQSRIALTPLRKFWIAWRTLRSEKHRRRRLAA